MATVVESPQAQAGAEEKFFFAMACLMSAVIVGGFSLNLALGRSTFAVPAVFHIHVFFFFGWVALYFAQSGFVAAGRRDLHRRLGWLAGAWVPVMVALGGAMMVVSMRRSGGPFFFDQNEFLISNFLSLVLFAALAFAAIRVRRDTGWHRRLMFVSMAILTGPGFGRLLPGPLLIPHAWRITVLATMLFPLVGMVRDLRRSGRIHPAWLVGVGAVIAVQALSDLVAYSDYGAAFTQWVLAGSAGAERPMAAFLPEGI